MAVSGVNHVTLAVSDLERSVAFYRDVLGLEPAARWREGAYLRGGELWLALLVDDAVRGGPLPECSHVAFSVEAAELPAFRDRIEHAGAAIWQENRTEGDSVYVLDPDGHKLELHAGSLETRLAHARRHPWDGLELLDEG